MPLARFSRRLVEAEDYCGPQGRRVLERLVDADVLQYGCREFLGVYSWNSVGGGMCGGLDVVGPSSRPARLALMWLVRDYGVEDEGFGLDSEEILLGECRGLVPGEY